ncbi:hypothetical protein [Streptomyces sp. NBC_01022]|uniref:hypothetical protein n=1 Tax=Streptomyces sp. NBC_01022 TaxID=2903723 RepID=UPI002DD92070|nr:hypothetical protein [Streptomyces sp. NBC_01022]WRZ86183.1 hypothetical protein OG316_40850 [Streptomyces sp. NBC_01022]
MWDLTTRQPVGEPLTGHTGTVEAVACTMLDGRPIAVTGGGDETVRVWDLTAGQPVGEPFTGHTNVVGAVACTMLDGRPVTVTGSRDGTVRIWDLITRRPVAEFLTDDPRSVAFSSSGDLVIGFHNDVAVYRRQPHNPTAHGGPASAHVQS